VLDTQFEVVLIILDEVDKLDDDDILCNSRVRARPANSSRARSAIGISNKIKYKDRMDERVKSSLCEREFVFPPYDANQLET